VTLVGEASRRHTLVAAADVAAFGAAVVEHPDAVDAYIPVGGPDAVSWLDVVAEAERVLGRPLEVRLVPPGEPLPGLPPMIADLAAAFEQYDSPMEMTGAWATFGVEPTSLATYMDRLFGGPAAGPAAGAADVAHSLPPVP
jgi:nucleoside-diphosphate-sugar epimerase